MYYIFNQNNSFGRYREPAVNVIVEADSEDQAIYKAEGFGLYFDGVASGRDCSCCGDRWNYPWNDDPFQTLDEALEFISYRKGWGEDEGIPDTIVV